MHHNFEVAGSYWLRLQKKIAEVVRRSIEDFLATLIVQTKNQMVIYLSPILGAM